MRTTLLAPGDAGRPPSSPPVAERGEADGAADEDAWAAAAAHRPCVHCATPLITHSRMHAWCSSRRSRDTWKGFGPGMAVRPAMQWNGCGPLAWGAAAAPAAGLARCLDQCRAVQSMVQSASPLLVEGVCCWQCVCAASLMVVAAAAASASSSCVLVHRSRRDFINRTGAMPMPRAASNDTQDTSAVERYWKLTS